MFPVVNMHFNYVPRSLPEAPDVAGRLAQILDGVRDLAARHAARNWVLIPVTLLLSAYLSSVARRFASLAARLAAGPLRHRPPRPRPPHPEAAAERPAAKPRVPVRFGWLIEWLGYHAVGRGSQLRHVLANDPEMAAIMAASPQAGRILRPLCRMLGLAPGPDLPPSLFPPRAAKAPSGSIPHERSREPSGSSSRAPDVTLESITRSPPDGHRDPGAAPDARVKPWQDVPTITGPSSDAALDAIEQAVGSPPRVPTLA